jgi:uncharacterized protein YeaO (DUF488 family)
MAIRIRRAYDPPLPEDGRRVLVERLWPRGIKKENLHISAWLRELAPSNELRRWFGHDAARWEEFQRRYREVASGGLMGQLVDQLLLAITPQLLRVKSRRQNVNLSTGLAGVRDTSLRLVRCSSFGPTRTRPPHGRSARAKPDGKETISPSCHSGSSSSKTRML